MRVGDRWWRVLAPVYDAAAAVVRWHRYQDILVADVGPGLLLDLGGGPTHLSTGLLRREVRQVGVDPNTAMLLDKQLQGWRIVQINVER